VAGSHNPIGGISSSDKTAPFDGSAKAIAINPNASAFSGCPKGLEDEVPRPGKIPTGAA
jgi:hypothetical protein